MILTNKTVTRDLCWDPAKHHVDGIMQDFGISCALTLTMSLLKGTNGLCIELYIPVKLRKIYLKITYMY